MTLLEKLAQKKSLNVDFHNHGQSGSEFRKEQKGLGNKIWGLLLSEGFSDLTGVLDRVRNSSLDVLYITNFSDLRYESWTSEEQIEIAKKAGYSIEQGEYYTFAKKGKRVVALGKSQEVPTTQGHILFGGMKRGKKISDKKSLDETLIEATDGELKIADHPYCRIKGQHGVMTNSKNPEEDAKKVDAFERNGSFYFPISMANWKAIKYSMEYNKPLLTDSDGHHPKDIGNTYNIFNSKDLFYTSERAFRDSINYAVINGKFNTKYSPTPFYRVFHHMMMIMLYKIRNKFYSSKNRK